jgi:MULE transposase domain
MYKIDTTFDTNSLKLLLSVIVSINNYRKTFLTAYYYIILELAASFTFVTNQLCNLAFYNCLKLSIIVKDFAKGLRATCIAKATIDFSLTKIIEEALVYLLDL